MTNSIKSSPTAVQSSDIDRWARAKATSIEWLAVIISCVALAVAVLGFMMTVRIAESARATAEVELDRARDELAATRRSIELWQAHTVVMRARVEAAGIELPPPPEEE